MSESDRELLELAAKAGFETSGDHITFEDVICTEEVTKLIQLVRAESADIIKRLQAENLRLQGAYITRNESIMMQDCKFKDR